MKILDNPTREENSPVRFGTYLVDDAISFLQRIKHKGISGVATSPPYNKAFNGRGKKPGSNWKNSKLMADNYSHFNDDLPQDQYIAWQRSVLEAALDCVGDSGVVLYNIGRKIKIFLKIDVSVSLKDSQFGRL